MKNAIRVLLAVAVVATWTLAGCNAEADELDAVIAATYAYDYAVTVADDHEEESDEWYCWPVCEWFD